MNRDQIIERLKNYFELYELVSPNVYNKYGESAWYVFRTDTLHCLLIIREKLDKPIHINNWYFAKPGERVFDERGYRDNLSNIAEEKTLDGVLYLSGHVLGCAFDFHINGMSSTSVRNWIVENGDLFPCKIRLERRLNGKPISWVHFDTKHSVNNPKVYLFDV